MTITVACHVEPVVESGVMSIVVTRQSMMEPHGIHYRKWSRVVAITVACQRVMEPRGIRRRKWSRVVAITMVCQGI